VVLVANADTPAPLVPCLDIIRDRLGDQLHSLWFNSQCERSNTILGSDFQRWCGPESVVERFGGEAVHYPPGGFGQSNLEIAERIIEHVRARVPARATVTEFYAGVGAIGLSLLPQLRDIRMNEVSPPSLRGLALGLAALAPKERGKVTVVPGVAGEAAHAASGADVVIADPPRKGLDRALATRLIEEPPARFIYVSCGLASLLSDAALLTAGDRLRLVEITAFNLMPFTDHVETVACFERA
jgi:tRNA/tmRNA/rRNA uracil-C5-methylase (TrmA/RlmC/RlmD family)